MTKQELVSAISEKYPNCSIAQIKGIIDSYQEIIFNTVATGEAVNVTGWGKFEKVFKPAGEARNIKTGEKIQVPDKNVIKFKFSTALKKKFEEQTK